MCAYNPAKFHLNWMTMKLLPIMCTDMEPLKVANLDDLTNYLPVNKSKQFLYSLQSPIKPIHSKYRHIFCKKWTK